MLANLVAETTTSTGTGNLTLAGALETRFRTFNAAFGTGSTALFRYVIHHRTALEWEVGIGYLSASTTLVRDTVLSSSNSDAAVNFSAGTKDVFCTVGVPNGAITQGEAVATKLAASRYYRPMLFSLSGSPQPANGTMYGFAFDLAGNQKIDRIGTEVTTAGGTGSVVRLGLYDSDGNGLPGNLISDAGTVASATTGGKEATVAITIKKGGRYWAVVVPQGAPSPNPIFRGLQGQFQVGATSYPIGASTLGGYTLTGVTGALPSTWSSVTATTGAAPEVVLRGA